jgi:hypothetical protein
MRTTKLLDKSKPLEKHAEYMGWVSPKLHNTVSYRVCLEVSVPVSVIQARIRESLHEEEPT